MTGAPSALLLAAARDLARGERAAAWRTVRAAAAAAPSDGSVQLAASELSWLLGDDRAALAQSERAMALGVAAATVLHVNQARDAGWYHRAAAVLERVLDEPEGGPAAAGLTSARALEQLVRLYVDHHRRDAAAAALDRHLPRVAVGPLLRLQCARVYRDQGAEEKVHAAIAAALGALGPGPELLSAAGILLELGAFAEADAAYRTLLDDPRAAPAAREALARLCLWRNDLDGALAHAAALPADGSTARRIRAAVTLLRGDAAGALPLLDAALRDDPQDGEAHLWRAEANVRLGRRDEACRDADRSLQQGYSFAAAAVRLLAVLPPAARSGAAPPWRRARAWLHARWGRPTGALRAARDELRGELEAICPEGAAVLRGHSEDDLTALLERALGRLGGNRCPPGTWLRDDGRLAPVPPTASPRILSRQALELIRVAPVEESFRQLAALAARFPDSSMPVVHRGELNLWLGRFAHARADLEAAIAIRRQTRWAWYGLTWLDILAGDPERALRTCAEGIRVMNDTEGPVALICRGEAYRLLGRLAEAREQLERSNAVHATRVSGWINLALVHAAAGDGAAQRGTARHVARIAPSLLSEAAAQLGEETFARVVLARPWTATGAPDEALDRVLRHALVVMRGNRASGLITYVTADGHLRHVPRHLGVTRLDAAADARALEPIQRTLERAVSGTAA